MIGVSDSPSVGCFSTPYIQVECTKNFMSIGDHKVCQKYNQIPDINIFDFSFLLIRNAYPIFDFFFQRLILWKTYFLLHGLIQYMIEDTRFKFHSNRRSQRGDINFFPERYNSVHTPFHTVTLMSHFKQLYITN